MTQQVLLETLLIAFALAADAFTIGLSVGVRHREERQRFRIYFHFGLFQALFPLIGFLFGALLENWVSPYGQWLAGGLLAFIGARMIYQSITSDDEAPTQDLTKGLTMVGLSAAVSMDALAVGISLGLQNISIWLTLIEVTIIGVITGLLTWIALVSAGKIPPFATKFSEIIAGLVLIGLGLKTIFL